MPKQNKTGRDDITISFVAKVADEVRRIQDEENGPVIIYVVLSDSNQCLHEACASKIIMSQYLVAHIEKHAKDGVPVRHVKCPMGKHKSYYHRVSQFIDNVDKDVDVRRLYDIDRIENVTNLVRAVNAGENVFLLPNQDIGFVSSKMEYDEAKKKFEELKRTRDAQSFKGAKYTLSDDHDFTPTMEAGGWPDQVVHQAFRKGQFGDLNILQNTRLPEIYPSQWNRFSACLSATEEFERSMLTPLKSLRAALAEGKSKSEGNTTMAGQGILKGKKRELTVALADQAGLRPDKRTRHT